jgi:small subunit ribosomal protein S9
MPVKQGLVRRLLLDGTCFRCSQGAQPASRSIARSLTTSAVRNAQLMDAPVAAQPIDFDKMSPMGDRRRARIVPTSPSYFTTKPEYTDDLIHLSALLRKFTTLPTLTPAAAPRVTWKTLAQYRMQVGELVSASRYKKVVKILQRLNRIHPSLVPPQVAEQIRIHRRAVDPLANRKAPVVVDEFGRAYGDGRRKSSKAQAWLVEGDGEVLVNGKNIIEAFGRVHDRESALWALKSTGRLDKYNVWATVHGGGTTGQAESVTLAVAKALMVHEPALKPALRRGKSGGYCLRTILTLEQPVSSHAIRGGWRGRNQEELRPGKCRPGSSVRACTILYQHCITFHKHYTWVF